MNRSKKKELSKKCQNFVDLLPWPMSVAEQSEMATALAPEAINVEFLSIRYE